MLGRRSPFGLLTTACLVILTLAVPATGQDQPPIDADPDLDLDADLDREFDPKPAPRGDPRVIIELADEGSGRIDVEVVETDLRTVMARLGAVVGQPIVVDPGVKEQVGVTLRGIPWREAVEVLARMTRCELEERAGILRLTQPGKITLIASRLSVRRVLKDMARGIGGSLIMTAGVRGTVSVDLKEVPLIHAMQVVTQAAGFRISIVSGCVIVSDQPLPTLVDPLQEDPLAGFSNARVNFLVEGVDLAEALSKLCKGSKVNLLVDPEIEETVSVSLTKAPLREVVRLILNQASCEAQRIGEVVLITRSLPIRLELDDADLSTILQAISERSGENAVTDQSVRAKLSVLLGGVSGKKAIDAVAHALGGHVHGRSYGSLVSILPLPKQGASLPKKKPAGRVKRIDLKVEGVDLADVMEAVGRKVGQNILVDPNVNEQVSVKLSKVPWRDAVDAVARLANCVVETRPGGILLLVQPPNVRIQARGAPVDVLLRLLAAYSGKNLALAGDMTEPVTLDLRGVTWLDALDLVCSSNSLTVNEPWEDMLVITRSPTRSSASVEETEGQDTRRLQGRLRSVKVAIATLSAPPLTPQRRAALGRLYEELRSLRGDDPGSSSRNPVHAGPNSKRSHALERELERLLMEIDSAAPNHEAESFVALRAFVTKRDLEGLRRVRRTLGKWAIRLSAHRKELTAVELSLFVCEGDLHLRFMAQSIRSGSLEAALNRYEQIVEIKERMKSHEQEIFHLKAEALDLRGRALADRAKRLQIIARFSLEVSAVIVAPPKSDEKNSAIINGRIYQEGDAILDGRGEEIEGLTVVEIIMSTVRLRWEDTEFVIGLPLASKSTLPSPRGSGIVVLNNGSVFTGRIGPDDVTYESITMRRQGTRSGSWIDLVWERGSAKDGVRWFSQNAGELTGEYWETFSDRNEFPIDPRYVESLVRWNLSQSDSYREIDVDPEVPKPNEPPAGGDR